MSLLNTNKNTLATLKTRTTLALRTWRIVLLMAVPMVFSACMTLKSPDAEKPLRGGHVLSVNNDILSINFLPDDAVAENDSAIAGSVLVKARGKVIQSIPHTLTRDAAFGNDQWLLIEDVNNDGLPDMLLTHAPTNSEPYAVKSLYLFDAASQTFQLQKQVSKMGDIDKTGGCVVVRSTSKDATHRTYCFSGDQSGWMENKRASGSASIRCNSQQQKVADCRNLRIQRDGEMRQLIATYIDSKSQSMKEEKRQAAALRFARNLRVGHEQWLLYRDARCASYVIEYNFPANTAGYERESCKLDLSSIQLQHYTSMLASLDK